MIYRSSVLKTNREPCDLCTQRQRSPLRSWRNWQTHQLEGLAVAIPWWFESTRPHHLLSGFNKGKNNRREPCAAAPILQRRNPLSFQNGVSQDIQAGQHGLQFLGVDSVLAALDYAFSPREQGIPQQKVLRAA